MAKSNPLSKAPPAAVEHLLKQLGKNIKTARLRRNMRLIDLSEKVGASRFLISDIERGKPTVSIASYMAVLWVLGLLENMNKVANPEIDEVGKILEQKRSPKTASKQKRELDNDF